MVFALDKSKLLDEIVVYGLLWTNYVCVNNLNHGTTYVCNVLRFACLRKTNLRILYF
jgi:hypothetical protein